MRGFGGCDAIHVLAEIGFQERNDEVEVDANFLERARCESAETVLGQANVQAQKKRPETSVSSLSVNHIELGSVKFPNRCGTREQRIG